MELEWLVGTEPSEVLLNQVFEHGLLRFGSIRQGFRDLVYDIKGILALGGVQLAQANSE